MSLYDSADLLARLKLYARRPASDQAMPDTAWYSFLTDAQGEVYPDIFSRYPDMGFGAPVLLTTADGGKTYTFGTDASGDNVRPFGHATIYPSLAAIPDDPLLPGSDFLWESGRIRIPNNRSRTFSAGPYARFTLEPDAAITASVQPQLYPRSARMLLVWKALEAYASRPGSGAEPSYYAGRYEAAKSLLFLRLGAAYNTAGGESNWYSRIDLGASGLNYSPL